MNETIYYNGTILTSEDRLPTAKAVVVEDGRIRAVLTEDTEVETWKGLAAAAVDLKGKVLIPGFIDGHSHFFQNTFEALQLNARLSPLGKADSVELLIETLKEQLQDPKYRDQKYLFAVGYDEAGYPDHRLPTRYDLDQVTDRPLALSHASGHNTIFNSAALEYAGITDDYIPPRDGSVGRFADGRLTGIFHENARKDVLRGGRQDEQRIFEQGIDSAVEMYVSRGVTTAQDGATDRKWYAYARKAAAEGRFPLDVVSYLLDEKPEELLGTEGPRASRYQDHYRVGGYKVFLDGSPQAKTAWLSRPYKLPPAGETERYRGYGIYTDEALTAVFKKAIEHRWQINVHTNGDEAIEQLIRVWNRAKEEVGTEEDLRPVSIHCQTVREDQLDKIAAAGMLVSFFVDHVFYWGDYHEEAVLGADRARRISPLASALERKIPFTLHQDTPVVRQDPLFAIHNAVNRRTRSGRILGEEYRISPWEALKAVTIRGAYQLFEENEKGSIAVGKRADFAILDANPLEVPPLEIKNISVLETIKDGTSIYKKKED